jgi:hypothetical protein
MIMDRTLLFSDGQAVTATAASTNVVDLGATGTVYGASSPIVRDIGKGVKVDLLVTVTQTFTNLTSLTISIETDDNAAFSSAKTVYSSPAYALADLATGAKYLLPDVLPVGVAERYVRLKYTVAGTAPDAGKITAGVVDGRQSA